jgi:hypothetical protein
LIVGSQLWSANVNYEYNNYVYSITDPKIIFDYEDREKESPEPVPHCPKLAFSRPFSRPSF